MIKYIFLSLILFIGVSCQSENKTEKKQDNTVAETVKTNNYISPYDSFSYDVSKDVDPYKLSLNTFQIAKDEFSLEVNIELNQGSFFVSPKSKGSFKGKFRIEFNENNHLEIDKAFTESPESKEVFDSHPYVNGYVNWVKENTKYNKTLKLKEKKGNFTVTGVIKFVIEPKCTLEEIPFILIYENGELIVRRDMC